MINISEYIYPIANAFSPDLFYKRNIIFYAINHNKLEMYITLFFINFLPEISQSSLSGLKFENNVLLLQAFKKASGALFNSSLFFIGSSYAFGGSLSL